MEGPRLDQTHHFCFGFHSHSTKMIENNLAAPAAKVAVAAAVVSKPLNDSKPEFARGISIQHAKDNKTFGTVVLRRINPNARPKINIYADNAEQLHQASTTGVVKVSTLYVCLDFVFTFSSNRIQRQYPRQLQLQLHQHQ